MHFFHLKNNAQICSQKIFETLSWVSSSAASFFRAHRQKGSFSHPVSNLLSTDQQIISTRISTHLKTHSGEKSHQVSKLLPTDQQIIANSTRFKHDSYYMENMININLINKYRYEILLQKQCFYEFLVYHIFGLGSRDHIMLPRQIYYKNILTSRFEWLWMCPLGTPPRLHHNMGRPLVLNLHFPVTFRYLTTVTKKKEK